MTFLHRIVVLLALVWNSPAAENPLPVSGGEREWPQASGPQGTWAVEADSVPLKWSVARGEGVLRRTTLSAQPASTKLEPVPERLVVLTFDDSVKSQFTVVRPALLKRGFGATFFITEGWDFATNKLDYMSWQEIAQLHRDGFEIGNHTRSHLGLSDRTLNQISSQLGTIAERCREHGIPVPTSFAYPGNAITTNALPILRTNGIKFARRGGAPEHPYEGGRGVAYEPGLDHPLLIPTAGDARPDWALADFVRAVEKARDGRIAVVQFHGVPDRAHPWVNTPPEKFEAYLDYLAANRYRVIALRDLAKYVDPLKEPRDPMAVIEARKKELAQAAPLKKVGSAPLDVLVIAPHPDDEVIGCAGVMLQALEQKRRVGVVVITSGDGYPALAAVVARKEIGQLVPIDFLQAGALRQRHSAGAMARIGVPQDELIFLGYPDSGLEKIYSMAGSTAFQQPFTQKNATYGVTVPDYHSTVHGRPAPYLKASVVGDLAEIIRDRQPKEIYVTHEADTHGDHRAAFWLVRDAIRAANYQGDFFTYVVHGAPPPQPANRRVTLTRTQVDTKRAALQDHQAGTSPIHDMLAAEYTKPEELFWKVRVEPAAAK